MLENRGVPVEDVEFYNHIHPVDDLLKFIDDVNANDDPEDTTIGENEAIAGYHGATKGREHLRMGAKA